MARPPDEPAHVRDMDSMAVFLAGDRFAHEYQPGACVARASRHYRIRIEGVIAERSAQGGIYVLDSTGALKLRGLTDTESLKAGQRVLFEGSSEWVENQVGVAQSRVRALGTNPPAVPERIELEQPFPNGDNLKWVETEGEIQFRGSFGDEMS